MFVLLLEMGTEGSVVRYRGVAGGPVAQWALQTHDWVGVQAATVFFELGGVCLCGDSGLEEFAVLLPFGRVGFANVYGELFVCRLILVGELRHLFFDDRFLGVGGGGRSLRGGV